MKAVCPKNQNHDEFITVAHVTQDWRVDSEGDYLSTVEKCIEVTHKPDPGNTWTCATCGAEATVTE